MLPCTSYNHIQQLLFTDFVDVERQQKYSASADQWVSYKASQKALLDGVKNVRNVIVYTGDIHNRSALLSLTTHVTYYNVCECNG
jgi:phosphodiesterase/alkaline phosphatase D-like protein